MAKVLSTIITAWSANFRKVVQNGLRCEHRYMATFETSPCDLYKLDSGPGTSTEISKEDSLSLYTTMNVIRKMEREVNQLYLKQICRGFCHLYIGQEAVGVGVHSVMLPQDTAITSYRCHAWALLMGNSVESIFAELAACKSGCSRGKGGSMHMYGTHIFGGNAIVGGQVPIGTGIALAHKYKGDGGTCVTAYGDGASDQGQVFESMNQAKLLSLPVLYLIENNTYSMGTPIARHAANRDLYTRGDAVPGIRANGMDVLSVREAAKFCFEYIRSGKGPLVLELKTYRYLGHSMSDPGTSYRSREEVQQMRDTQDPLKMLKTKILSSNLATEEELLAITKETNSRVSKALLRALIDKELDAEEVAYDVYCEYEGKIKMPGPGIYLQHKNSNTFPACNK